MVEKEPNEIYDSFNENGCVKLSTNNEIIGFMGLYQYGNLYEAGSLCVWEQFRNLGLGKILQGLLLEKFTSLPIFLVTNVDKVKNISDQTGLIEMNISQISEALLSIIEDGGKLLSDDNLYFNKKLYINEKFYSLM